MGRLVLSTLHTNAAAGAVTRLVDLGVPAFLVRDVLRGVLGQELMLTPCPACGSTGCAVCGGTGVGERRLLAELWVGRKGVSHAGTGFGVRTIKGWLGGVRGWLKSDG